ncbi:hypothetical protein A9257_20875 [Vibrio cyclitrophicus]|uniref:glycosyltransferase family 2 protein n=1 Tax=Vibrio cyclitrophicus TaxID=47951 RepID=UPI0007EED605|nr:glycosyltransferase family 2 protein [Vibrio cyclitrophicus]OBT02718.1 hypothetical protein A9257_20875 [Vibrio cyclitrophicus]
MSLKLCVAISTLNDGIYRCEDAVYDMDENVELLIIHQVPSGITDYEDFYSRLRHNRNNIKIITSNSGGLSKSRNLALQNTSSQYIIFSDDDNSYIKDLCKVVSHRLSELNFPEFLSFRIEDETGEYFKAYPNKLSKHNRRSILRLSSIENVYDVRFIRSNGLMFDESFGLGAKYPSCEQPIFASCILSSGGIGYFFPETVTFHPKENSGDNFYTENSSLARKKMLEIVFGNVKGKLLYSFFVFKKLHVVPNGHKITFLRSIL